MPAHQPYAHHPILVDLLTPDYNDAKTIELMPSTVATSLATRAAFAITNIFINHRAAHSAMVFDDGEIVRWQPVHVCDRMKSCLPKPHNWEENQAHRSMEI